MPRGSKPTTLRIALNMRLTHEQHEFVEHVAKREDTTLSGAVRAVLEAEMDRPVWQDSRTGRVVSWRELRQELDDAVQLPPWVVAGARDGGGEGSG